MKAASGQIPDFDGEYFVERTGGDLVVMHDDLASPVDGHHMAVANDDRIVACWRTVRNER